MANKKISELTSVTLPLAGTEEIAIVQSGETKKITANNLKLDKLSNDISTYTPATTPLSGTEKALIHDGIDFKEVAISDVRGDFIPLSGTTVGNPVTGDIEIEDYIKIYFPSIEAGFTSEIFSDAGSLTITSYGVNFQFSGDGISVGNTDNPYNFVGFIGNEDYSEIDPTNKLIYAQRQYVDNALTASVLGTTNRIAKFTSSGVVGDSQIYDNGSQVGIGASSTSARLDIRSQGDLSTDIVLNVRNSTNTSNIFSLTGNGNAILSGSLRIISTPSVGNIIRPDGAGTAFQFGNSVNTNYGEFRFKSDGGADLARISNAGSCIIGGTTTNASAIFQIDSTTKGFLPPRMTTVQKNAIASPTAGLIVYDTTDNKHYGYNGTTWNALY